MLTRWVAVIGATLVTVAVIVMGGSWVAADLDISGIWDAQYSITCDVVLDQEATELTATINCGAGAAGTLEGSVDTATGVFSLSGQLGLVAVGLEGSIVDGGSLGGTFSALPLAAQGTFLAVRVDPGSGTELSGAWLITLVDVFSGGCTVDIDQVGVDLTSTLDCEARPLTTLEGTLEGRALTLMGPLSASVDVVLEATVSEDGGSLEGVFRVLPGSPIEITGSFTASRRGGPAPTVASTPIAVPVELPDLPGTGVGLTAATQHRDIVRTIVVLTMLGAFAVAGGWYASRRSV